MEKKNIDSFQKQSVLAVIGLVIITFGFYFPFWLRRQTKVINLSFPSDKIGMWFFPLSICFTISSFAMNIPSVIMGDNSIIWLVDNIIDVIDGAIILVWAFKLRNRMNLLLRAKGGTELWFNGPATIFFTIIYLQYKINKIKDIGDVPQGDTP